MATRATRTYRSHHATDGALDRRTAAAPPHVPRAPVPGAATPPAHPLGTGRPDDARALPRRVAAARRRRRRRRAGALSLLLVATGLVGAYVVRGALDAEPAAAPRARDAALPPSAPDLAGPPPGLRDDSAGHAGMAASYPVTGPGTFDYAVGRGEVLGSAGTLRRFIVAVEDGMGQDPATFADRVDAVLGDPRGWTASGRLRLQRVPKGASAEFTIFLASPDTSEKMCAAGGLYTQRFTSCRVPGRVIINVARWLEAVPNYAAPLDVYRAYAINHEVGHQLGYGHEACPAPGQPAPVMQQQTLGLKGCVAYGWPYLNGIRYAGPSVP